MAVARRSLANRPAILVAVLFALTLLVIDRAGPGAPTGALRSGARDAFASLGDSVARLWPFDDSAEVRELRRQNEQLAAQLQSAQADLQRTDDAVRQRDVLLRMLFIPTIDDAEKVIAPVIAMETTNFDNTVELGKGRAAGIEVGMPVVNAEGLVGRVVAVSDTRSSVTLITDTASNVGARVGATGEVGVLVGAGEGNPLRLDLIEADSPLQPGDVIVTNGMQGSLFPAGVVLGQVSETKPSPMGLRRQVSVTPAVDFSKLSDVVVVKWSPRR